MTSIVLELQRDALDRSVPITDLLRKALVVARKLGQSDFQKWIQNELNGYEDKSNIPSYREMIGHVRCLNPYNGWIPAILEDPKSEEMISKHYSFQSISEIENLLENRDPKAILQVRFSPGQQQILRKAFGENTEFSLFISPSSLSRIIDTARNTILHWSLKLEADGILGEGLSFSPDEKVAATKGNYNINNFFGDVRGSQIQQATEHSIQKMTQQEFDLKKLSAVIKTLRQELDSFDLDDHSKNEVASDLSTIEAQLQSPHPKMIILKESLKSIRSILEAAGGGATAQILIEIGKLLLQ